MKGGSDLEHPSEKLHDIAAGVEVTAALETSIDAVPQCIEEENGLPQPYIKMLEEVEDNGHERDAKLDVPLDRQ